MNDLQRQASSRPLITLFWVLSLALFSTQVLAGADEFVRRTSDRVLKKVLANKASLQANPGKLYQLIRSDIAPHLDFSAMSRSALGKHWNKASGGQKSAIRHEFQKLLIRTYGTALLKYNGQEIQYRPASQSGGYSVVRTKVPSGSGSAVSIDYRLRGGGNSWKVVDIKVGGASLVSNYRTQFSRVASQPNGIDTLIKQLKTKNAGKG